MTRKEAVERSGLPAGTIARRIWAGWPPERLFDPAARHRYRPRKPGGRRAARLFTTPYGQLTLAEIAAIVGIAPKAMQMRLTTYRLCSVRPRDPMSQLIKEKAAQSGPFKR